MNKIIWVNNNKQSENKTIRGGYRMIEIKQVTKSFDGMAAVKETTLTIRSQNTFGLLGTNGAGKSTLLRMMAGIIRPDAGEILIDGNAVWENPSAKKKCFYISDEQFFFPNATPRDMVSFYGKYYAKFDYARFEELLARFGLETGRKIQTFSKGMKKQLSVLIGLCANASYLFCDETFDGLDPVMRQGMKAIFAKEMDTREFTLVIASHNLRELEDTCDHIGLLHKGGVLLSKELSDIKCNMHKVQCVFEPDFGTSLYERFQILQMEQKGRLVSMIVRENEDEIRQKMEELSPVYYELMPLSLEEIFISETGVVGYDIKNLIL